MSNPFILALYEAALVLPYVAVLAGIVSLLVPRRERRNVAEINRRAA
jgi:uncharacterized protein YjeT (DUF2065 family)